MRPEPPASTLESTTAANFAVSCTGCRRCVRECEFLKRHGTPGELARRYADQAATIRELAYSCSLCGLCEAVCPHGLAPEQMFLALRQEAVRWGEFNQQRYRRLLNYEKAGASTLLRALWLPAGCQAVFFPGCALPGIRPVNTVRLYRLLRAIDPTTGIFLDCCHKPSHDLGLLHRFNTSLNRIKTTLTRRGITTLITACPSCHQAFAALAPEITVVSAYSLVATGRSPLSSSRGFTATVHDACATRHLPDLHQDVRTLCSSSGITLSEMGHSGSKTLCCGEGGAVGFRDRALSMAWSTKRCDEAGNLPLITYCAGCTSQLQHHPEVYHLIDLIVGPEDKPATAARPVGPIRRWLNRLGLKMALPLLK